MTSTAQQRRPEQSRNNSEVDRRRVILVAHGSPDERHAAAVTTIADRIAVTLGISTEPCYLEHDVPRAQEFLAHPEAGQTAVLPLLLTAGFHWRTDIPPLLARPGQEIRLVAPPPPRIFADGIAESAQGHAVTQLVVALAGSRSLKLMDRCAEMESEIGRKLGAGVSVTTALTPSEVGEKATRKSIVIPLVVAPGILCDRITQAGEAAGAMVAPPFGSTRNFAGALAAYLIENI